jgi:hypothetical protein
MQNMDKKKAEQIEPLKRMRARALKMVGRFRRKSGGENVLDAIISRHLRDIEAAIEPLELERQILARAIEIAQDYDFTRDEPDVMVNGWALRTGIPAGPF